MGLEESGNSFEVFGAPSVVRIEPRHDVTSGSPQSGVTRRPFTQVGLSDDSDSE
jgi:hypothetical protein